MSTLGCSGEGKEGRAPPEPARGRAPGPHHFKRSVLQEGGEPDVFIDPSGLPPSCKTDTPKVKGSKGYALGGFGQSPTFLAFPTTPQG